MRLLSSCFRPVGSPWCHVAGLATGEGAPQRRHEIGSALLLSLAAMPLAAQTPRDTADSARVRAAERRFAFAETYLGADLLRAGAATLPAGGGATLAAPVAVVPRVTIGGLHFWGHADFHVSFVLGPDVRARLEGDGTPAAALRPGLETGARWYPLALRPDGRPRPFVGLGWQRLDVTARTAAGDGAATTLVRFPLQAGLSLRTGRTTLQAGVHIHLDRDFRYAAGPGRVADGTVPAGAVWLGVQRHFDGTRTLARPVAGGQEAEREARLRRAGRLSGPFVGLGVSTATAIGTSSWNAAERPELGARLPGTVFPEIAAGWEWPDRQLAVSLVARRWTLAQDAYGLSQAQSRASVALEALRFLGDYHGFVPFVGVSLGRDHLRLREAFAPGAVTTDRAAAVVRADSPWIPGLVVGWDIQPTRTQSIVLRTNLRYAPTAALPMPDGRSSSFAHFEFNFIQVVWHPRR